MITPQIFQTSGVEIALDDKGHVWIGKAADFPGGGLEMPLDVAVLLSQLIQMWQVQKQCEPATEPDILANHERIKY